MLYEAFDVIMLQYKIKLVLKITALIAVALCVYTIFTDVKSQNEAWVKWCNYMYLMAINVGTFSVPDGVG